MFKVKHFSYNGMFVKLEESYADYTAKFSNWTDDPGIGVFECSDGRSRLIPVCVLVGCSKSSKLGNQDTSKAREIVRAVGFFLGTPSSSR
jgi:hypothetical protein